MADSSGLVRSTAPGIAKRANLSLEETKQALDVFESPDNDSRSLNDEGRKILRVDGGYQIINFGKYRDSEMRRLKRREYHREYWHKRKLKVAQKHSRPLNETQQNPLARSTLQKQSTEADKNKEVATLPLVLDSQEFRKEWERWKIHRKEIKHALTPATTQAQLEYLAEIGEKRAVAAIRHTIFKGWQGIREENGTDKRDTSQNPRIAGTALEGTARQYKGYGKV